MKSALAKVTMLISLSCLNASSFAQIKWPLYEPTMDEAYKAAYNNLCQGSGFRMTLKEISTGNSSTAWEYACEIIPLTSFNKCSDSETYVDIQPLIASARIECRSKPV
jgi:hypothetical protein